MHYQSLGGLVMTRPGFALRLLVGFVLAAVCWSGMPAATTFASFGRVPECTVDNILTPRRAYADWARTMLDTALKLPRRYVPPNLVSVDEAGVAGEGRIRARVIDALRLLRLAAREAGNPIEVTSAYRSYERQELLWQISIDEFGRRITRRTLARPGHSEHQLGTALDFKAKGGSSPWLYQDWAHTRTGKWMKANAWKFGFVMSYPKGERAFSCYSYEPWHYRYFGRRTAALIHESGLTSRQWLWRHGYGVVE